MNPSRQPNSDFPKSSSTATSTSPSPGPQPDQVSPLLQPTFAGGSSSSDLASERAMHVASEGNEITNRLSPEGVTQNVTTGGEEEAGQTGQLNNGPAGCRSKPNKRKSGEEEEEEETERAPEPATIKRTKLSLQEWDEAIQIVNKEVLEEVTGLKFPYRRTGKLRHFGPDIRIDSDKP